MLMCQRPAGSSMSPREVDRSNPPRATRMIPSGRVILSAQQISSAPGRHPRNSVRARHAELSTIHEGSLGRSDPNGSDCMYRRHRR